MATRTELAVGTGAVVVVSGIGLAAYLGATSENTNLKATIAAKTEPVLIEGIQVPSETPTPTETASFTPEASETPTATSSNTPESTRELTMTQTPAKTNTETATETPTLNPESVSIFHVPHELLTQNDNGIARLDVDAFRTYFKNMLANKGLDSNGQIVDFMANMLATNPELQGVTLAHNLNFWFTELKGLGWTGSEKVFADRLDGNENELRASMFENDHLTDIFTHGADGVLRYSDVVQAKDFENSIALAVINRFLSGAGMVGKSSKEVIAYLNQPDIDTKIRNTIFALIGTTGYQSLPEDPIDPNKIVNWPGAVNILTGDYNFVSDTGKVCIAYMGNGADRNSQREVSTQVFYHFGLEKGSPQNDETLTQSDSKGDIIVTVTYDPNAEAAAGINLSPDGKGAMRIDIFRVSAITDPLYRQQIADATGQHILYEPPTDNMAGALYFFDGSRWIACAVPVNVVPTKANTPQIGVTLPSDPTPPTEKFPTPVNPNQPTSAPTPTPGHGQQTLIPGTPVTPEAPHTQLPPATNVATSVFH